MPQSQLRALVVDDDVWAIRLVKGLLTRSFPELDVDTRLEPDVSGQFEVFFIDNDFHGEERAAELACTARANCPNALIIAFSGTLDAAILRHLISAGCNGVCDKSVPGDLARATEIVRSFLDATTQDAPGGGILGAINSIRGLLTEWNGRLDRQAREAA